MSYFTKFYGNNTDIVATKKRYDNVKQLFAERFHRPNEYFFSSSGRMEIVGNHTDHNHGKVLVGAINRDIVCACSPTNDGKITVVSQFYPEVEVDIHDLSKKENELNTSNALVRGVLDKFVKLNYQIGGFCAYTESNIFAGAGMSSSAAYELLICVILNVLYNGGKIAPLEEAKISQYAENVYFGKPSGLLDQSGVAFGGITYIDFKDVANPLVRSVQPPKLDKKMLLINTGGDHANLTHAYADIISDMKNMANKYGKDYLADVDEMQFFKSKPENTREYLRALHFFEETRRVDKTLHAIENNDQEMFYLCISNSGTSSRYHLQNCMLETEQSSPITKALDEVKTIDDDSFCRVHGGGFRGTILCFVTNKPDILNKIYSKFGNENVCEVEFRAVGAAQVNYQEMFA